MKEGKEQKRKNINFPNFKGITSLSIRKIIHAPAHSQTNKKACSGRKQQQQITQLMGPNKVYINKSK